MAATLGFEDHERAPADEMLAAAERITRCVDVPVTVDAEAGYSMQPAELVAALRAAGAAGCNLEDTEHAAGRLRDPDRHAAWLRAVREAATEDGYGLVINARIDVFVGPFFAGAGPGTQESLVPEALRRAHAYLEAGVDSVYPIALWETDALRRFIAEVRGPVNVLRLPQTPSLAELAALGVARLSWGPSSSATPWITSRNSSHRYARETPVGHQAPRLGRRLGTCPMRVWPPGSRLAA